ncbi:LysM peptidoglycan-binding domain-containing protein [Halobacillus salinarum]|uniref:LysM peptidoglycan-binding domain-containing protein n=1 Tax=Halobacillus salinarum TaxID=2932257 RepID=A0ABY4ES26_9BACI|nr:LysM domain-containing protein [Halobacillus salinarum]UOQ44936.1 LysM peptidoglycan-binding domain-containing protein [Halobacillus salinarum]
MNRTAKILAPVLAAGMALGASSVSANSNSTVTVKSDDTLWSISQSYDHVTLNELMNLNPNVNPNNLEIGSKVKVTDDHKKNSRYIFHKVEDGDTFYSIAQNYPGVELDDLYELNPDVKADNLQTGSKIKLRDSSVQEKAVSKHEAEDIVRKQKGYMNKDVNVEYDNMVKGEYLIHVYDEMNNHTATRGWYLVSPQSGNVTDYMPQ